VILEGEGEMPSFSDLEDQDIADILAWIESQA
jgi:mono/diheme cytochrome c family protein